MALSYYVAGLRFGRQLTLEFMYTGSFCLGTQSSLGIWENSGSYKLLAAVRGTQGWRGNWILVLVLPGVGCDIPGWLVSLSPRVKENFGKMFVGCRDAVDEEDCRIILSLRLQG